MPKSRVKVATRIKVITDKDEERKLREQIKNISSDDDRVSRIKVYI